MKKWSRQAAPLMLVIVVASLILSACDTGDPPQPTAVSGLGPSTTAATPTSEAENTVPHLNPDVSGKLQFWHFWGSPVRRTAIRRVLTICSRELPNIQVEETVKPFGQIWTENAEAVEAGTGMPDVIVEDRPKLTERAKANVVQNLRALAERDGLNGDAFWPFTWQQSLFEGEAYGVPFETDVRVLFYNKSAFREVGLDPEKPPTTWDELEAVAAKLDKRAADGSYERIGFMPMFGNAGPEVWGYTNEAEWITEDGTPVIDNPAAVETVEWLAGWIQRYGGWESLQAFRESFGSAPDDSFMSGRLAMVVDINGYASLLNFFRPRYQAPDGTSTLLEWGVSHIPFAKKKASWSGGFALSIPRGSTQAEAAWEFIKCATGAEAQLSWARDTYAMPANRFAARDELLLADPTWQFFVDAMEYTSAGAVLPEYPAWSEQLSVLQEVWTGNLDAKTALNIAQQAVLERLDSFP